MKKNLLATSALVAAGALASQGAIAESKPIEVKVGGYYEQWVAYYNQNADFDNGSGPERYGTGVDVQEDGEIYFEGSTTTDNGLTFGFNVQLETSTSNDQIDENYLFVRGSFGEIVLGSENGPAYVMHYGVDIDKGYGLEEGDTSFYWFSGTSNQLHTSRMWLIDNDAEKIRWISPRVEGFQIGASYIPESRQDNELRTPNEAQNVGFFEDVFAAAINYDQTFNGLRVRTSLGGQYVGDDNGRASGGESEVWGVATGLRLGYGGFEGAVAYSHQNGTKLLSPFSFTGTTANPDTNGVTASTVDVVAAGVSYTDGPMAVSLTGAYGMSNNDQSLAADPTSRDTKQIVVLLGAGYTVGPGVAVKATAGYAQSENITGPNQDFTGYVVATGIRLSF